MDPRKHMLIINGEDKTESVQSFSFSNGKCDVVFKNSPKIYSYNSFNVRLLKLVQMIEPNCVIVRKDGNCIQGITNLFDFGDWMRIERGGMPTYSYPKYELEFEKNCLSDQRSKNMMDYFRAVADAISLKTEDDVKILSKQYERITHVSERTILARYLDTQKPAEKPILSEKLIYPFGINQSQKTAVENAFSSQISVIQGPPGTGKTQTILNII